jgi:O-antigen/teichoic acid export membrane protein
MFTRSTGKETVGQDTRGLLVVKAISEFVNPRARAPHLIAYKATADVVSKTVTLLVTIAAARVLAPDAFGVLALAMTTGWILGVASDAGLPLYLARSVAKDADATAQVVRDVMRWRVRFGVVALTIGVVIAVTLAPAGYGVAFGLLVAAQLAGAVLETLSHVFRGLSRSEIESTITITQRLGAALLAAAVLIWYPSLLLVATALLIPPVLAVAVSFTVALRLAPRVRAAPTQTPRLDMTSFTRDAAPIGLGVLVSAVYFRCDVYFVHYWHGLDTVGMYNAVFRLVDALRLFPAAVLVVFFPELCRAATLRPLRRLTIVLVSVGTLAAAFIVTTAAGIVHITYGEAYAAAAAPLQVLALALPLFFVNYALTHQVIAWEGQRMYVGITLAALVTNVVGNLLMIPSHGMLGAAWSTFFTECVVAAGCVIALRRRVPDTPTGIVPIADISKGPVPLFEADAP